MITSERKWERLKIGREKEIKEKRNHGRKKGQVWERQGKMTTFENEGKKMKQSGKIEREKENKFKKGKKRKTEGMTRKSGVKEQGTPPEKKYQKKKEITWQKRERV